MSDYSVDIDSQANRCATLRKARAETKGKAWLAELINKQ